MTTQERFDALMQEEKEHIAKVEKLQNIMDTALLVCMTITVTCMDCLGIFSAL